MEQDKVKQTPPSLLRRLWGIVQWGLFGMGCMVVLIVALLGISWLMDKRGYTDIEWDREYELLAPSSEIDVLDSLYQPLHPYLYEYCRQYVIRFHSADASERFEQEILKLNPNAEEDAKENAGYSAFLTPLYDRFRCEHGEGARFRFELYAGCPYQHHRHSRVFMHVCRAEDGVYYVCAEKY